MGDFKSTVELMDSVKCITIKKKSTRVLQANAMTFVE